MFLSDAHKIIEHPASGNHRPGRIVILFMLRDLEKVPRQCVWALPRITGANPLRPEDAGEQSEDGGCLAALGPGVQYRW